MKGFLKRNHGKLMLGVLALILLMYRLEQVMGGLSTVLGVLASFLAVGACVGQHFDYAERREQRQRDKEKLEQFENDNLKQ